MEPLDSGGTVLNGVTSDDGEPVPLEVHSISNRPSPIICYGRILLGEITPLLTAMKRSQPRWSSQHQDLERDPLVVKLKELRTTVIYLEPDDVLDPNTFLDPFLAIIRSEDTTGPVTKSALAAVNRMLNYGLLTGDNFNAASAVEAVAAAVTHARFVGTDQGADEVVLWEILTVLRTLILGPVGHLLTNESVCEILNSSFRICFETRLSELLRNCTEDALRHMVQLLFARLPQFKDDPKVQAHSRRLKMRAGGEGKSRRKGKVSPRPTPSSTPPPPPSQTQISSEVTEAVDAPDVSNVPETPAEELTEIPVVSTEVTEASAETVDEQKELPSSPGGKEAVSPSELESLSSAIIGGEQLPAGDTASVDSGILEPGSPVDSSLDISHTHLAPEASGSCTSLVNLESRPSEHDGTCVSKTSETEHIELVSETTESLSSAEVVSHADVETKVVDGENLDESAINKEDFINAQGVKFTNEGVVTEGNALVPYGMPCVREVFRFLISLTSPTNEQNTPAMILTALNLLTVGLEVGAEHINNTPSLLTLLKDQLCRNLFMLLKPEFRLGTIMASLRLCTLLCESLRPHFKFQIEMFLNKLTEIITSEAANITYPHKELALETVVQLWRIPGFITELFLNYDCDVYASNLFEDLTKVLSQNAFPVQGLYSTNLLSLEALFTVIETIESHSAKTTKVADTSKENNLTPMVIAPVSSGYLLGLGLRGGFAPVTPNLRARTVMSETEVVSREHLLALKEKKNLLAAGTDQFNAKPEKGIKFLQDNGIVGDTNEDISFFLRENPQLCKQMIGEYISKKKNVSILSAFVKSFEFKGLRVDESLRMFLESFRLPGEAPLIAIIIEHFSAHWHLSNNEPFGKEDAAFTLAYAVIMLNVDQHNQNAKKQNIPMTVDQFRNNLRGVNDGSDFDQDMLEEIYNAIRSDEIVMPAEQTGLVKENYLWKMLLKRGVTKEGHYVLASNNITFDKDLFALCWGPTVASLSYVFDKSTDDTIIQRALSGFKKCAIIAARYGMTDVFDNLIVSLCKFTTLTTSTEAPEHITVSFGSNRKAQLAAKTVFRLVTSHGDILREGWKNVLDLLLQLFRCRLLPTCMSESEDFVETSGKVTLIRETPTAIPRVESGLLSSLYSYISLGDSGTARGTNPEDIEHSQRAKSCIADCHPEKLITESAFLRCDSLTELLKAMMGAGDVSKLGEPAIAPAGGGGSVLRQEGALEGLDEYSQAFILELVVQVLVANKDRAVGVWPGVRNHIHSLLMGAAAADKQFLLERCVVAMLRLAKVLLRRPNMSNPILQSLRMLLLLRPCILLRVSLQIVCGLHEVLSVNTEHIQDPNDWTILFNLLECAGAGAKPPPMVNSEHADTQSDSGSVSDSEFGSSSGVDSGHFTEGPASDGADPQIGPQSNHSAGSSSPSSPTLPEHPEIARQSQRSRAASPDPLQNTGGWILVGREGEIEPVAVKPVAVNEWDIVHQRVLGEHRPEALVQAVDTLAFLVRDRRITQSSLPAAVQACRTFVEATLNGGKTEKRSSTKEGVRSPSRRKTTGRRKDEKGNSRRPKSPSNASNAYDADESDSDDVPQTYQQVSEKLLDLMDTLHTASSHIVGLDSRSSTQSSLVSLWPQALCPLLQGIARYCCDSRATVRNMAMTYLQRALLNHDLQALSAGEWESCFNKVLFPLLAKLLQPLQGSTAQSIEETRVRAATLVQKVYLRHLTPLLTLPTFTALWLTILDFMDKYLNTHRSDHLSDAIPEILKNMLLVMETTQVFHTSDGFTRLWTITWDRIDAFLPDFRHQLFKSHPPSEIHKIEVVPDGPYTAPVTAGGPCSPSTVPKEAYIPPTLREQGAARLSLSQEDLPTTYNSGIILQPPLPPPLPVTPPEEQTPLASGSAFATAPQMLSTEPLASGSLIFSPIPPTLPHITPSIPPPLPQTTSHSELPVHIFASPTSTAASSLPPQGSLVESSTLSLDLLDSVNFSNNAHYNQYKQEVISTGYTIEQQNTKSNSNIELSTRVEATEPQIVSGAVDSNVVPTNIESVGTDIINTNHQPLTSCEFSTSVGEAGTVMNSSHTPLPLNPLSYDSSEPLMALSPNSNETSDSLNSNMQINYAASPGIEYTQSYSYTTTSAPSMAHPSSSMDVTYSQVGGSPLGIPHQQQQQQPHLQDISQQQTQLQQHFSQQLPQLQPYSQQHMYVQQLGQQFSQQPQVQQPQHPIQPQMLQHHHQYSHQHHQYSQQQQSSSSIFPISIPSFLNPFAEDSEPESSEIADAKPSAVVESPIVTEPCIAKDTSVTTSYQPTSLLFSDSADTTPFLVDPTASADPYPSSLVGIDSSAQKDMVELPAQALDASGVPLVIPNYPSQLTLLSLGQQQQHQQQLNQDEGQK